MDIWMVIKKMEDYSEVNGIKVKFKIKNKYEVYKKF